MVIASLLIKGTMVQLLGLAKQWTLNEMGIWVLKYRLTQDLSYTNRKLNSGWKLLVNRRIVMEVYPEMIDSWCLPHILHFIALLCWFCPGWVVLIAM
jgi:hypothetical protein